MTCLSCGQIFKSNREANEHLTLLQRLVNGRVVEVTPICNRTDRPG